MEKEYCVNYGTGAGNYFFFGALEEALEDFDKNIAYTQQSVIVEATDGSESYIRRWIGVEYDPEESDYYPEEIISYGSFGYYSPWIEIEEV